MRTVRRALVVAASLLTVAALARAQEGGERPPSPVNPLANAKAGNWVSYLVEMSSGTGRRPAS
jgi:hypothetical protein